MDYFFRTRPQSATLMYDAEAEQYPSSYGSIFNVSRRRFRFLQTINLTHMTKTFTLFGIFVAAVLASFDAHCQNITTPRTPSPAAMVSQTVGISTITVKYSRPAVKGREVWGKLVPYGWNVEPVGKGGEAPWRAGANENTTIEFSHAATVEGKEVPATSAGSAGSDRLWGGLPPADCRHWRAAGADR